MFSRIILILCVAVSLLMSSCGEDPGGGKEVGAVKQMTLIYAVNKSSLSGFLASNEDKILEAMSRIDTDIYKVLLYKNVSGYGVLYQVGKMPDGSVTFQEMKKYTDGMLSTNPERFGQVLRDALSFYPGVRSNLFLWGHGSGWYPEMSDHTRGLSRLSEAFNPIPSPFYGAEVSSFGGEYNSSGKTDWLDLKEMAEMIPDGTFDTIWFDCCFMSSIEVAYQLRNKCSYMMGCAAELMGEGTPYNIVLPKLLIDSPDRTGAVSAMCDYFRSKGDVITVALLKMEKIDQVAESVKSILKAGTIYPTESTLVDYAARNFATTNFSYRLYDFGDFIGSYANVNGASSLTASFNKAMSEFVIYKGCSDRNFNGTSIDKSRYSGMNCHIYNRTGSKIDRYYEGLDWFNRLYK